MIFASMPQGEIKLQFRPLRLLPRGFPAVLWRHVCLGGGIDSTGSIGSETVQRIVLNKNLELHECIVNFYPDLTLPELARLIHFTKTHNLPLHTGKLLACYRLRHSEDIEDLLSFIAERPAAFQDWCSEKKLGFRDLSVLRLLKTMPELTASLDRGLDQIAVWNMGKNEGVQTLEIFFECAAMNKFVDPAYFNNAQGFLRKLKQERYPQTQLRDEAKDRLRYALPWPSGVQTRLDRQGDTAKIEVKFHVNNAEELRKILDQLAAVAVKMQNMSNQQTGDLDPSIGLSHG